MAIDLEKLLRPVDTPLPPFPPKMVQLANGQDMVIRQITRDDIPTILPYIEPFIHVERDYYDIVGARLYAELLGYYRHRVVDEYVLIGQVDGELATVVNGRLYNASIGVSYHTFALLRGLRVGAHGFAAKMEYHMDYLKQDEVLIVAESPIGFRRWMIEYKLEERFHIPHELGGAPSYALTRPLFERARASLVVGRRPVPKKLLAKAEAAILPPSNPMKPPFDPLAATRAESDPTGTSLRVSRRVIEHGKGGK